MQSVLYKSPGVFAGAFIVGGIVMLIVERLRPAPVVLDAERTPLPRAFGIGLCQMLALVPGVSRSGATIIGGLAMRLDRPAAAEFSFFVAIPTMCAAFAHEFLEVRDQLTSGRGSPKLPSASSMAFLSSLLIIKPFLGFVRRSGFAPFAWYRIVAGPGADRGHLGRVGARMILWLRRRFVTGFFVLVPLVISIVALIWVFDVVDGFTAPLYERYFAQHQAGRCRGGWASSRPRR